MHNAIAGCGAGLGAEVHLAVVTEAALRVGAVMEPLSAGRLRLVAHSWGDGKNPLVTQEWERPEDPLNSKKAFLLSLNSYLKTQASAGHLRLISSLSFIMGPIHH